MNLNNNKLTRHIPRSIGKPHSLQVLDMGNNCSEGPIPREVGHIENLKVMSLDGNKLSGNIPHELLHCRNLIKLNLSSNNLNGTISRSISQLTSLTGLVLSHNQLSGSIPAEICGGFTNPSHPESEYVQYHGLLDLSYNRLTDRIPPGIKNCVILEELHLQVNLLNESIPVELAELKNLMTVDLSFRPVRLGLFGLFSANEQYFSLTPKQPAVLSAMAYKPNTTKRTGCLMNWLDLCFLGPHHWSICKAFFCLITTSLAIFLLR